MADLKCGNVNSDQKYNMYSKNHFIYSKTKNNNNYFNVCYELYPNEIKVNIEDAIQKMVEQCERFGGTQIINTLSSSTSACTGLISTFLKENYPTSVI